MPGRKRALFYILCTVLLGTFLAGCKTQEKAEDVFVVEKEEAEEEYNMAAATRGDVILSQKISCVYEQENEEALCFPVTGRRVDTVFVKKGDEVKKGDLLAQLVMDGEEKQQEYEYTIAKNELLLNQAKEKCQYDVQTLELNYRLGNETPEAKEETDHQIKEVQRSYRYTEEDCEDAIQIAELRLAELEEEKKLSYLYAGMDGTVTYLKENLNQSVSDETEVVLRISDNGHCVFSSDMMEWKDYFEEGKEVEFTLSSVGKDSTFHVIPYEMADWDERMMFQAGDDMQDLTLTVGNTGLIQLVLDSRENVLRVPASAIHTAQGKDYVYVEGENGIREAQWVTVGLEGNDYTEIVEGLEEGDFIIVK